jgi:catechol 2,3-dioxygenase-like lactoylglutathione lyase family enzyme
MTWYLADLVMRFDIEDDPRGVVHINTCLVEANAAEEAYAKAMRLGTEGEAEYENSSHRRVRVHFLGLRELLEIYEPLEDGSEIVFEERIGVSDLEARRAIPPKAALGVFRQEAPEATPDYGSADILAEVNELVPPRIATIHHVQIMIPRGSEQKARWFYGELLGMTEIEKPPRLLVRGGLWMAAGDRQLHLGIEDEEGAARRTRAHIAYEVTKLEAWRARLAGAGFEILEGEPLPGLRRFELRDPFGNRLELVEREL